MMAQLEQNSFIERFSLTTPIALAPMALASGGELAAACARAGALGLVGGAYGDLAWTKREYNTAVDLLRGEREALARLACGFITWKLLENRSALDFVLEHECKPAAIMLSFGDPTPFARDIIDNDVALICQIQNMEQLPQAIDAGASVIVAQGGEAGGHGKIASEGRGTFTFVPEIADWLAAHAPKVDLLAAGGIADGRGLAASLMLGADGVMMGTRLWAAEESLAPQEAIEQALAANGDASARSSIFDILREKNWPADYDFRALRNDIHRQWEGRIEQLRKAPEAARADYQEGVAQSDYSRAHVTVGEGAGLIATCAKAGEIIADIDRQARRLLER